MINCKIIKRTFILSTLLILCLSFVTASMASVQIRAKDSNTNALLSGATVVFKVDGRTIATKTTGSNGLTDGVNVEIGKTLYIDVTKSGYEPIINSNKGRISAPTTIDAVLTPTTSTETRQVRVIITDELGKSLSGVSVQFKIGTTVAFTQTTDSNGHTSYIKLNVGEFYTFEASKVEYQTASWDIGTIANGSPWTIGPHILRQTDSLFIREEYDNYFTQNPKVKDASINNFDEETWNYFWSILKV